MANVDESPRDENETARVEVFSDGVFAIAMTLLVLDIKVPHASDLVGNTTLPDLLEHEWPAFVAYVLSFATILVIWTNHHKLFRLIRRCNHTFLMINGALLMGVTLVPFTTALLAEYITHPGAPTAAAVYSGAFILIALLFNVLWHYAAHKDRLLLPGHDRAVATSITRQYRFGPPLYLAAFLLALFSVPASVGLCALVVCFFALPIRGAK